MVEAVLLSRYRREAAEASLLRQIEAALAVRQACCELCFLLVNSCLLPGAATCHVPDGVELYEDRMLGQTRMSGCCAPVRVLQTDERVSHRFKLKY